MSIKQNIHFVATIRQQIGLEETIVKEIEENQLTWYGHGQRMAEGRLPKTALKWMPKEKRARGRLKKYWMEGIRKAMNERNLNEGQWEDRKQWSVGVGQQRKKLKNTHARVNKHTHIYLNIGINPFLVPYQYPCITSFFISFL